MLFREIIAVYCENYTEHVNALWAECRVLGVLMLMRMVAYGLQRGGRRVKFSMLRKTVL
jgi:hypothetical protein